MSALWILQNRAHRFLWFGTPERDWADHLQTAANFGPNWRLFVLFKIWKLDWQYFNQNLTLTRSRSEIMFSRISSDSVGVKFAWKKGEKFESCPWRSKVSRVPWGEIHFIGEYRLRGIHLHAFLFFPVALKIFVNLEKIRRARLYVAFFWPKFWPL